MISKTRKKQLKRSKTDKLKEECGVFGISDHSDASALVALGLHALQHRGQEGCGIVSFDGESFHSEKRQGLVGDHFTKGDTIKKLPGSFAIGHNRYSTTGETSLRNIQPFFADLFGGGLSISHNGNLTNAISLRESLVKDGAIFRTTSDTETIVQLIAKSKRNKTIDIVNEIIDIIVEGLQLDNKVKIHNFGTFKLNKKNGRVGRNPKTKEEFNISSRNVITFKASKILLKYINNNIND